MLNNSPDFRYYNFFFSFHPICASCGIGTIYCLKSSHSMLTTLKVILWMIYAFFPRSSTIVLELGFAWNQATELCWTIRRKWTMCSLCDIALFGRNFYAADFLKSHYTVQCMKKDTSLFSKAKISLFISLFMSLGKS